MIFGHEGLPGSGKSLESMVHVVNALIAGRTVVTNVEGINHKAIADYCAIPLTTVEQLLVCIEAPKELEEVEKVAWVKNEFLKHQVKNSLWIFDEINQFFPPDRQPLTADWAKFVTEHRHLGMDVLVMGQDLSEVHTTWRRRIQRYTRLTKLDMMGKDDHYHWASLTNVGRGKFKQTAEGKKPYNKDYFGFYKSHVDGVDNKENYSDQRFSVIQPKHKVIAVLFFGALLLGIYFLYDFFTSSPVPSESLSVEQPEKPLPVYSKPEPVEQLPAVVETVTTVIVSEPEPEPAASLDYLRDMSQKYQLRLTGIIDRLEGEAGDSAFEFIIEFLDPSYRVKERMMRTDVASLGWAIERKPYGLLLTRDDKEIIVRPWPLDNWGKVPQKTVDSLKVVPDKI